MERLQEFWHGVERAVIAAFKVCACLYVVRCVVSFRIVPLEEFCQFIKVLVAYIL